MYKSAISFRSTKSLNLHLVQFKDRYATGSHATVKFIFYFLHKLASDTAEKVAQLRYYITAAAATTVIQTKCRQSDFNAFIE